MKYASAPGPVARGVFAAFICPLRARWILERVVAPEKLNPTRTIFPLVDVQSLSGAIVGTIEPRCKVILAGSHDAEYTGREMNGVHRKLSHR